ncbi:MAG TPA: hypothetical protein VFZ78_13555 [Flavisolibacter sp.]
MTQVHVWTQQLLGKASLDDCSIQEIKDVADRFPFYAPAQILLLQKLRRENSPYAAEQYQKAVLYYHDPLEFDSILDPEKYLAEEMLTTEPEVSQEAVIHPASSMHATNAVNEMMAEDSAPAPAAMHEVEPVDALTEPFPAAPLSEEAASHVAEVRIEETLSHIPVPAHEAAPAEPVAQQGPSPAPENAGPAVPLFEPYHTVDYFASQGIRLSQEEATQDKFGRQLKSFTEWLKTMKRLPEQKVPAVDPGTESKVQHLAEDSVHDPNVVTEAMAEVWLKQGNQQKALETYHKLSLLNPSKRAYFAAKIEHLKQT